jgi:peptidoglycan/LPS O-acetylase OafA/YrhL
VKIIADFQIDWTRIVAGIFLVSHFHWNTFFASELDPPLWTITLEIWSYILLPLVIYTILRGARTVKSAAIGLAIWIGFLQGLQPLIIKFFMTDDYGKGWEWGWAGGAKLWMPYWNLASFFSQFLLGAAAALFIAHKKAQNTERATKYDLIAFGALFVAFVLIQVRLVPVVPDPLTRQPYISPLYAGLVAVGLATAPFSKVIGNFLENRFFKRVAILSFGLYIWHYMIMQILQIEYDNSYYYYGTSQLGRWADNSLIVIVLSWLFASISWRFFESPILNWNKKNIKKREEKRLADA